MDPLVSDEEIDAFIDEAMGSESSSSGTEDDDDADDEREESPSEGDDDEDDSDDDDDDEEDDAEGEEGDESDEGDDDDDDAEDPVVAELRQKITNLEQKDQERLSVAEQQKAQVAQVLQAGQVLTRLRDIRQGYLDKEDEAGWDRFQKDLVGGFERRMLVSSVQTIRQMQSAAQNIMLEEAETTAQKQLISRFDQKLKGLSTVERATLELCADDKEFRRAMQIIVEARRSQTQPAREAKRNKRISSKADAVGARSRGSSGGKTSGKDNYDNYNPDRLDDYLDDMLSA